VLNCALSRRGVRCPVLHGAVLGKVVGRRFGVVTVSLGPHLTLLIITVVMMLHNRLRLDRGDVRPEASTARLCSHARMSPRGTAPRIVFRQRNLASVGHSYALSG
jgi:hypothetical protein